MAVDYYFGRCDELSVFFAVSVVVIAAVLLALSNYTFIITWHRFFSRKYESNSKIGNHYKMLCLVTLFGFASWHSANTFIQLIICLQCPSKRFDNPIFLICIKITQQTYFVPLTLLYILFMQRVIAAFEDSIIEINNYKTNILRGFAFLLVICIPIGEIASIIIYGFSFTGNPVFYTAVGVWLILYITAFTYTCKLLSSQMKLCCTTIFTERDQQQCLLNFVTKMTVCVYMGMVTSIICGFLYAGFSNIDILGGYQVVIFLLLNMIDFFLNCICLSMQWPMFDSWYEKYLQCCHHCALKLYQQDTNHMTLQNANSITVA